MVHMSLASVDVLHFHVLPVLQAVMYHCYRGITSTARFRVNEGLAMEQQFSSDVGLTIGRVLAVLFVLWLLWALVRPFIRRVNSKTLNTRHQRISPDQSSPRRLFWKYPSYTDVFYPPVEVELRRQAIRMKNKRARQEKSE